jgi:hypothetical protein
MQKTAYVFCLLLINFTIKAQSKKDHYFFKFGVKSLSVSTDNPFAKGDFYLKPAIDFGFGINYNLSKNIRFQPEIHYNPKGFKSKYNFTDSTYFENSLELHYLDFCPNFSYTFGGYQCFQTRFIVWGGPYLGLGLTGKSVISGVLPRTNGIHSDSTFSTINKKFGDGLNRMDYGFNVGFGIQYEKFAQFGVSYSLGFNNIADKNSFATYNKSVGIYLIFLFDEMF